MSERSARLEFTLFDHYICAPMKIMYLLCLAFLSSNLTLSQNLIPDPSFEAITDRPGIWLHYPEQFNPISPFWKAATANTPDIVSQNDTPTPFEKGTFGLQAPRSGEVMIGMQLSGERVGQDFFRRDFLITPLLDSTVIGQCYKIAFWMNRRVDSGIYSNNVGISLSDTLIDIESYANLHLTPVFNHDPVLEIGPRDWVEISGTFRANQNAAFLLVGNFYDDASTTTRPVQNNLRSKKPIAYYFIDDFFFGPVDAEQCPPLVTEAKPIFLLSELGFMTNSAAVSPQGLEQLESFVQQFGQSGKANTIKIIGYTDNIGTERYNLALSLERAFNVAQALKTLGMSISIEIEGLGEQHPIDSNDTSEGRARNRRVEIFVLN